MLEIITSTHGVWFNIPQSKYFKIFLGVTTHSFQNDFLDSVLAVGKIEANTRLGTSSVLGVLLIGVISTRLPPDPVLTVTLVSWPTEPKDTLQSPSIE